MNKRISRHNKRGRSPQPNLQANSTLRPYESMEMKKRSCSMLLSFLSIWIILTASAQAGQVVTDEVKLWAREAIAQEKALETVSAPNTVAVLYFHNKTGWSDLDLLQKGLTLMLITDLSKVKEIQLVERVKIQALAEELGLGVSGLVASDTAPKMGELLGVEHVIGGDILKGMIDDFQLKSNMLSVPVGEIYGQVSTEGKLLAELFRMEKDLLFEIIKRLKIELTPALELELKKSLTTSIDAFRRLLQGLEESDRRNYERAAVSYQEALKEDPSFTLAANFLRELKDLQLWAGRIEDGSKVEAYTKLAGLTLEAFDYIPEKVDPFIREEIYEEKTEESFDEFIPGELNPVEDPGAGYQGWGYTWSGRYKPGLQTVGSSDDWSTSPELFLNQEDLDRINSDSFLAYEAQKEEDIRNQEILKMYREAVQEDLSKIINWQLVSGSIRSRDDFLTQQADAQAGRVLTDKNGRLVRVQQYILRPNAQKVSVYNVSVMGLGSDAQISTIDWTTTFIGDGYSIANDLRELPWNGWLIRIEGEGGYYVNNTSSVELDNMYVKFTNSGNEALQEQRWFDPRLTEGTWIDDKQYIDRDELTINDSDTYTYVSDAPAGPQYTVTADPDFPGNFNYVLGDDRSINVACSIVGDIDTVAPGGSLEGIDDIWDVLRVNTGEGAPYIGGNNLEIAIDNDKQVFSRPIDVVYIPMSRMLWKVKGDGGGEGL